MELLHLDKRICVCIKPAGVLSTDEHGGMPEKLRAAFGDERACVRSVHRLDRTVSGLMVYARSHKAAQLLSEQIRTGGFEKEYLAVVHGRPPQAQGRLTDLLRRDRSRRRTLVVAESGKEVREAALDYETLGESEGLSLLRIRLLTGRTHQIRVQFSARGLPLWGDGKYGLPTDEGDIALWSYRLAFRHPETDEQLSFSARPPADAYPWRLFKI